jgi:RND family efflux transporter MFP subunit
MKPTVSVLTTLAVALLLPDLVIGHPGHAPLPTTGAVIDPATGVLRLSREAITVLDLKTEEVAERAVESRWFAYAVVQSPWTSHAFVSSQLAGRIVRLHVQPGESVERGQLLAELESPDLQQLRSELRNAKNKSEQASATAKRLESAASSGAIPSLQWIEASNQAAQSANFLEVYKRQWLTYGLSRQSLATALDAETSGQMLLPLKAPIAGVVTHADLSIGKIVDPKEHLFEIIDSSTVWLRVQVLEKDLKRMQLGQPVTFAATSQATRRWSGTIDRIGTAIDPVSHLASAWATLKNPDEQPAELLPGMTGQVSLGPAQARRTLSLPVSAVLRDGAEQLVLVEQTSRKEGSEFKKQSVVLGQRNGDFVELKGGEVFPGDRVITQGSHELAGFFTKGVLRLSEETARDIGLKLETAGKGVVADTLTADGVLDIPVDRRSVVSSPLSGIIERIDVDRSQSVRAGDVIAGIRSPDFQSLQLELVRASLEHDLKQTLLKKLNTATDAVAGRRILETEADEREARFRAEGLSQRLLALGLTATEVATIRNSGELLPSLPLRSSVDGSVVGFDKVLGHVVRSDEPLFEVHDVTRSFVEAFVAERDAARVTVGQAVRVRFASDDAVMPGRVVRLANAVSPQSRTLSVWIQLDAADTWLPHNSLANITFIGPVRDARIAIPNTAILKEGSRRFVFVRGSDGTFTRRSVTIGRMDDRSAEVLRGLEAGESVAAQGIPQLQAGFAAIR